VRSGIARLNADGALDTSFVPNPGIAGGPTSMSGTLAVVNAIALQPDGKVLIGGTFTNVNGQPRQDIARLNSDGTLDTSFVPSPGVSGGIDGFRFLIIGDWSEVNAMVVQTNGAILWAAGLRTPMANHA
jgi:uncharacterized delta-60 repeat protein